jgi:hypothetical protein
MTRWTTSGSEWKPRFFSFVAYSRKEAAWHAPTPRALHHPPGAPLFSQDAEELVDESDAEAAPTFESPTDPGRVDDVM